MQAADDREDVKLGVGRHAGEGRARFVRKQGER